MRMPSRVLSSLLVAALLSQITACGTLLYPERRGQIEGKIDPVVAGMDAIGILFFVIPGLIAFGIDFASGAIYLPSGKYSVAPEALQNTLENGKVNAQALQQLILETTGEQLPLSDLGLVQTHELPQQLAYLAAPPRA